MGFDKILLAREIMMWLIAVKTLIKCKLKYLIIEQITFLQKNVDQKIEGTCVILPDAMV